MLRLTRIADYGVLLMANMAASDRPRLTAADLATATRIPSPTVSKVLQTLLMGKLLISVRGAHGGYSLARTAEKISVAEILQCFDGDLALTECNQEHSQCDQHSVCGISRNWQGINRSIARVLRNISLSDMMAEQFEPEFCLVTKSRSNPSIIPLEAESTACTSCDDCAGELI